MKCLWVTETSATVTNDAETHLLSPQDLYALGMYDYAFIKRIGDGKLAYYEIFTADGEPVGYAETRELAEINIRQIDLEPVNVH